jgi:hypothetical protein
MPMFLPAVHSSNIGAQAWPKPHGSSRPNRVRAAVLFGQKLLVNRRLRAKREQAAKAARR